MGTAGCCWETRGKRGGRGRRRGRRRRRTEKGEGEEGEKEEGRREGEGGRDGKEGGEEGGGGKRQDAALVWIKNILLHSLACILQLLHSWAAFSLAYGL